jgi:hypothetical protein
LAAARAVGGACVPLLPPEQRDAYIRHVSSTEGLAALAAAVVRNASSVLRVGLTVMEEWGGREGKGLSGSRRRRWQGGSLTASLQVQTGVLAQHCASSTAASVGLSSLHPNPPPPQNKNKKPHARTRTHTHSLSPPPPPPCRKFPTARSA